MAEDLTNANGYVGPHTNFGDIGLSTSSHQDAEFEVKENEFIIKFKATQPIKITGKVMNVVTNEDSRESVFIQTHKDLVNVFVSFSQPGDYKLQIYALRATEESQQLPNVFTYLIHYTGKPRKWRVFPKQFAQWRNGCALYEPFSLAGDRVKGDVPIRVRIPEALAAALTIGEEWTHLEPADDSVWHGVVSNIDRFKDKPTSAVLNANFDPDDESRYSSLLEYKL